MLIFLQNCATTAGTISMSFVNQRFKFESLSMMFTVAMFGFPFHASWVLSSDCQMDLSLLSGFLVRFLNYFTFFNVFNNNFDSIFKYINFNLNSKLLQCQIVVNTGRHPDCAWRIERTFQHEQRNQAQPTDNVRSWQREGYRANVCWSICFW